MGYTTEFSGHFNLDAPLTEEQAKYLDDFASTRRVRYNPSIVEVSDPVREAVGLPAAEGAYFVGYASPDLIMDYNKPPSGQPGLWCQWIPGKDENGAYTRIEWDSGEKFYEYTAWLRYIINHFLKPWGRVLNGEVKWYGEDPNDIGLLVVKDNMVTTKEGRVVYE